MITVTNLAIQFGKKVLYKYIQRHGMKNQVNFILP